MGPGGRVPEGCHERRRLASQPLSPPDLPGGPASHPSSCQLPAAHDTATGPEERSLRLQTAAQGLASGTRHGDKADQDSRCRAARWPRQSAPHTRPPRRVARPSPVNRRPASPPEARGTRDITRLHIKGNKLISSTSTLGWLPPTTQSRHQPHARSEESDENKWRPRWGSLLGDSLLRGPRRRRVFTEDLPRSWHRVDERRDTCVETRQDVTT